MKIGIARREATPASCFCHTGDSLITTIRLKKNCSSKIHVVIQKKLGCRRIFALMEFVVF